MTWSSRVVGGCLLAAALAGADGRAAAAGAPGGGTGNSQPVALRQPKPVYPVELRRLGWIGTVDIEFIINEKGAVSDAWVVRSPDVRFSEAAVAAMKQWEFKPAMKAGQPVSTQMVVSMVFNLTPAERAAAAKGPVTNNVAAKDQATRLVQVMNDESAARRAERDKKNAADAARQEQLDKLNSLRR